MTLSTPLVMFVFDDRSSSMRLGNDLTIISTVVSLITEFVIAKLVRFFNPPSFDAISSFIVRQLKICSFWRSLSFPNSAKSSAVRFDPS